MSLSRKGVVSPGQGLASCFFFVRVHDSISAPLRDGGAVIRFVQVTQSHHGGDSRRFAEIAFRAK
jgi:hypothetical protein